MNRLSVQHFVIIGLLFWGLPATFVIGPEALLYTIAAAVPVYLFSMRAPRMPAPDKASEKLGSTAALILVVCALTYVVLDATAGQKLLAGNLFLQGSASVERSVERTMAGASQGRGVAALLGTILTLLPFAIIDVSTKARQKERWALWAAAAVLLCYGVTASRGGVIIAMLTIVIGRTSNWRRVVFAGGVAVGLFALASVARGDFAQPGNPLTDAFSFPYFNLALMQASKCGHASWYAFVAEFFKKFMPGFIYPKTVYSFNYETSLCIYPNADHMVESISIFTWLGEMFYYTPSILTALSAGVLLGWLARVVNRKLVRNELPCARLGVGLACIIMLRSRSQDVMSFLIAQWLFLMAWPHLCKLSIYLRDCVSPEPVSRYDGAAS